jgi:hypothetical protein
MRPKGLAPDFQKVCEFCEAIISLNPGIETVVMKRRAERHNGKRVANLTREKA